MPNPRFFLLLLVLLAPACTASRPATVRVDAARVPADVMAARKKVADDPALTGACDSGWTWEGVNEASDAGDWSKALSLAEQRLAVCTVDMDAHMVAGVSLEKLGRTDEAAEHHRWLKGLLEAVLSSGDGRSPQTAYYVLTIPEEYAVLRRLGLKSQGQALLEGGIDAMGVIDKDGVESTVYFNPEPHWRYLTQQFP